MCPALCGLAMSASVLTHAYNDGRDFVQGMHSFRWIMDGFFAAVVVGLSIITCWIGLWLFPNAMPKKTSLRMATAILLLGGCASMLPLLLSKSAHLSGRDRAYAELDLTRVSEAIENAGLAHEDRLAILPSDDRYKQLPASIRDLHPLVIFVGNGVWAIRLDGGGPMYREGLLIAPKMTTEGFRRYCAKKRLRILASGHNVAMYRFSDDESFTDPVLQE